MPRKTWDTKADWDTAYDKGAEGEWGHPSTRPEVRLHYVRGNRQGLIDRIADHYDQYIGPAGYNRRFCIVGGGFGWVADALYSKGFTNVVVADDSVWIQAEKDNTDEADIIAECAVAGLAADHPRTLQIIAKFGTSGPRRGTIDIVDATVATSDGRTAIRNALGGWPQVVVSEDVMTSLDDAECLQLASDMAAFPGAAQTIVHVVSTLQAQGQDPVFNWKSLADWKALIPGDTWIDARTGEVL